MNHSTLKKFAAKTRVDLIEQVRARLKYVTTSDSVELREQSRQVAQLKELLKKESEEALVERVAYIWFNRLAALRFMDAEGRHPLGCRVVTATEGNTQPELLQLVRNGSVPDGLKVDLERINGLLDGKVPSANAQAEVYRMLVVAVCNYYYQLMPFVFEKIADYTELLLPEDLLSEASVAEGFSSAIDDSDCAEVEVLGWLYQYYIAEKKDAVMARKKAVPKEDIPAVTQLFTPHWIVRYMVENSLGRLWMQSRPSSKLAEKMPYYIADAEENADAIDVGELKVSASTDALTVKSPEEIRLIDPACGSGHILTYAFDLLYLIYEEEGYEPSSIPGLILTKNLYGVEIDERAAELAYFALTMKAQQHYGRFLRRQLRAEPSERVAPQICCLEDITFEEGELKSYMDELKIGGLFNHEVLTLMHQFEDAKNLGSLIQPVLPDIAFLKGAIRERDLRHDLFLFETHRKVLTVLRQVEFLSPRYHCAVANPPYMGSGAMNGRLLTYVKKRFTDSRVDLMACFIERNLSLAPLVGMINQHGWMFLRSFTSLRKKILTETQIESMLHLGPRTFPEISGEVVQSVAFILTAQIPKHHALFVRLVDFQSTQEKSENVRNLDVTFQISQSEFLELPDNMFGYWLTDASRKNFSCAAFGESVPARRGLQTGDTPRFIRYWSEVGLERTHYKNASRMECISSSKKWFRFNNGGEYRRWYGNLDYVVNWKSNGKEIKGTGKAIIPSEKLFFEPSITWSRLAGGKTAFREIESGVMPGDTGPCAYPESHKLPVLGFLNSAVTKHYLKFLVPSMTFLTGDIENLPFPPNSEFASAESATSLPSEAIAITKADWDNFEISWDFKGNPLLVDQLKAETLSATWQNWNSQCSANIARMKELEEGNNCFWINSYGLQDELTSEVSEEEITLARADPKKDMAAFISYAIGCMFGRYSLDKPGLILANASESLEDYLKQVSEPSFTPDDDNIIPVLDGEWFDDDIVARFREFLKVTFGESTLRENIDFIEESLGKDLRKYFVTDFYKDHLKTYKKRPIYWLFQSPKKSFQALIYLHRYNRDTVNLLLNDYLREFQEKLKNRRKHLDEILASESTSARDKTAATKEQTKIDKALPELADWEREVILPLAQQRLEIDLDDGVKVNYPKFGKALAKVTGLS